MPIDPINGISWQQRYGASEIYVIRCRIEDKPGMLGQVATAIGQAGAQIGQIVDVAVEPRYKITDLTLYLAHKEQVQATLKAVRAIKGVEVLLAADQVMEVHRRGAIEMVSRVPIRSLTDLRMLYTPGVATVCEEIQRNPAMAWDYTGLCDRIAIITNGTAILGLGDIGSVPGLPVMEGKAAILAEFVGISGVPILMTTKDVDTFVDTVVQIAPSFGAIQLEDVAAPACFEIERRLMDRLDIPVFHDDQHGTATVVLAAVINALKKTGREASNCSALILGAGAAGIAVGKMLLDFGIGDIVMYDTTGPLYEGRKENMSPYKQQMAQTTNKKGQKGPLTDCFVGKDLFIGVSRPKMVTPAMVKSMAKAPIVFPLGNPVGEITTQEALAAGAAAAADGREINNALAYPGLFRGALDARASDITMAMKIAAARELAGLAEQGQLLPDMLDRGIHQKVAAAVVRAWNG